MSIRKMGGVLGLEAGQNLLAPFNRWLKRGMDLTLAVLPRIAAAPVLALAAL